MIFSRKKIRYAVVGLGNIAQRAVLPAFRQCKNSEVTALVSGDHRKLAELGKKYGIRNLYTYDEYEECLNNNEVDAVYIALPNTQHRDFTLGAARQGIHVLCDKPLATSSDDCRAMIEACRRNHVKLMTGYRLHFEPANLKAIELIKKGRIGQPISFHSVFGFLVKERNIRTDSSLGGGPLFDIGIYCINAARYLFQDEPLEVIAWSANTSGRKRFREINETVSVMLKFPKERLAQFTCSFGSGSIEALRVVGTEGDLSISNPYSWSGSKELKVTAKEKTKTMRYKEVGQFSGELDYFSHCILKNKEPEPSGIEGLADIRVIEGIFESLETGLPVRLAPIQVHRRPSKEQEVRRRQAQETELIGAQKPAA